LLTKEGNKIIKSTRTAGDFIESWPRTSASEASTSSNAPTQAPVDDDMK
jgi:hypothetical protein